MNEMEERELRTTEEKHGRRSFFKRFYKYLLGFGAFTIASLFGLKRNGEIRLGKMKSIGLGPSEAYGMCSASVDCAGGGGMCSASVDCAGGGGMCSASVDCAGGGGQCSASVDCAGGGGQCSASVDCAGS